MLNFFDKYITILEKASDLTKKINSKKYLKPEKRFNTKESFHCFYIPVILFDSVYRKDGSYYISAFGKTYS